jgi:hypothetical protein
MKKYIEKIQSNPHLTLEEKDRACNEIVLMSLDKEKFNFKKDVANLLDAFDKDVAPSGGKFWHMIHEKMYPEIETKTVYRYHVHVTVSTWNDGTKPGCVKFLSNKFTENIDEIFELCCKRLKKKDPLVEVVEITSLVSIATFETRRKENPCW